MRTLTLTLAEFLLARIADDEATASRWLFDHGTGDMDSLQDRVLAECAAKRRIVAFHESWPVLVESPPKFDPPLSRDINSMTIRMSQQMAWLTEQEYRTRFGDEPPTAPMLAALASVYADHPDYDPDWRL